MSAFHGAIQDYLDAINNAQPREVTSRAEQVIDLVEQIDQETATWALMALVPLLADAKCPYHALTACLCEPMMRQGGDPWLIVGLLVERLRDSLHIAAAFRRMLSERCAAAGVNAVEELRDRGVVWQTLAQEQSWNAYVASTLELLALPLVPVVAHFPQARQLLRADPATLDNAIVLAGETEGLREIVRLIEQNAATEPLVSQFAAVQEALQHLAATVASGPQARRDANPALLELYRSLFSVELATRNLALSGLAELIATADVAYLGDMGQLAGSIVETGADPGIALDAIMTRLTQVLEQAGAFVQACRLHGPADANPGEMLERHGQQTAAQMPAEASALQSTASLCLGAIAMLSRSEAARKRFCGQPALIERAAALEDVLGPAGFLRKMLQVLDDESLFVLDSELQCGWRITIRGIADNFQLHTLLAGAIVGPRTEGWVPALVGIIRNGETEPPIPGRPLDRRAVGIARNLPCTMNDLTVWSHLQLWTWEALQPDGTLPENPVASSDYFVWNEGVPADIPLFEGKRIILIGNVSFSRSWNGGRVFSGMHGDLTLEEKLDSDAVTSLLHRIASAPRTPSA